MPAKKKPTTTSIESSTQETILPILPEQEEFRLHGKLTEGWTDFAPKDGNLH